MIVFYNTQTGLCIRSANGIASGVTIIGGKAYYGSDRLLENMTDTAYTDVLDQDICTYDANMNPTPKLFSALKQDVPDEVKIAAIQDAIIALSGV